GPGLPGLLAEAAAAISRIGAPQVAQVALLNSQLAAIRGCLAWEPTLGQAATAPWRTLAEAPGLLADHWQVLDRLARAGLPGSGRLAELISDRRPLRSMG
ncbi:MAG: hypothetical protein ACRDNZ_11835, partial [Streptosporangiaceae bacterium]